MAGSTIETVELTMNALCETFWVFAYIFSMIPCSGPLRFEGGVLRFYSDTFKNTLQTTDTV